MLCDCPVLVSLREYILRMFEIIYFHFIKIDEEEAPVLFAVIVNHFEKINKMKEAAVDNSPAPSAFLNKRPSLIPVARRNTLIKELLQNNNELPSRSTSNDVNQPDSLDDSSEVSYEVGAIPLSGRKMSNRGSSSRKMSLQQVLGLPKEKLNSVKKSEEFMRLIARLEEKALQLAPKLDGRIKCTPRKS
jgi:hypothetical protein